MEYSDALLEMEFFMKEANRSSKWGLCTPVARHTVVYFGEPSEKEDTVFSELKALRAGSYSLKFVVGMPVEYRYV